MKIYRFGYSAYINYFDDFLHETADPPYNSCIINTRLQSREIISLSQGKSSTLETNKVYMTMSKIKYGYRKLLSSCVHHKFLGGEL
jgi:hypothetical protein